jgi:glutathione S-transferase
MLKDSDVPHEDVIVSITDILGQGKWGELKHDPEFSGPFKALPVVHHRGVMLNESMAICEYIADVAGYMPLDPIERAQVNMIISHLYEDVLINITAGIWGFRDWDRDIIGGGGGPMSGLPTKFQNIEDVLKNSKSDHGYAVGSKISAADFAIFTVVDLMIEKLKPAIPDGEHAFERLVGNKPCLLQHHALIATRPRLAAVGSMCHFRARMQMGSCLPLHTPIRAGDQ